MFSLIFALLKPDYSEKTASMIIHAANASGTYVAISSYRPDDIRYFFLPWGQTSTTDAISVSIGDRDMQIYFPPINNSLFDPRPDPDMAAVIRQMDISPPPIIYVMPLLICLHHHHQMSS